MESPRPIRLLICEDHRMLAEALAMVLERDDGLELVTPPVDTGEEASALSEEHQPDVVLMDIQLKGEIDGIEATRRIKATSPATKVVIMSALGKERMLVEAVEAGASGFLDKTEAVQSAVDAVKDAAAGEPLIDPALLSRLLHDVAARRKAEREMQIVTERLTGREIEILELVAQGRRNEDVAATLHLSVRTVQTHIQNILRKLGVHSKLEAVAFAARAGVVAMGGAG